MYLLYSRRRRRSFSLSLTGGSKLLYYGVSMSRISTQSIQYTHESSRYQYHHFRYNLHLPAFPISVVIKPLIDKLANGIRWYQSHIDDRCMDTFDTRKIADRLFSAPKALPPTRFLLCRHRRTGEFLIDIVYSLLIQSKVRNFHLRCI